MAVSVFARTASHGEAAESHRALVERMKGARNTLVANEPRPAPVYLGQGVTPPGVDYTGLTYNEAPTLEELDLLPLPVMNYEAPTANAAQRGQDFVANMAAFAGAVDYLPMPSTMYGYR